MIIFFGDGMFRAKDLRFVKFWNSRDPYNHNNQTNTKFTVRCTVAVNDNVVEHASQEFKSEADARKVVMRLMEVLKEVRLDADDHRIIDFKADEAGQPGM